MRLLLVILFCAVAGSSASSKTFRCPRMCPKVIEPVCGSDGKIYVNECDMLRRTCGKDVIAVPSDDCSVAKGTSRCEHKCPDTHDPVCASNGRTFLNLCVLQVEICRLGSIEMAHHGLCLNGSAPRENCPVSCRHAPKDGPICGSDGNTYPSTCEMKLKTCGQGVVRTSLKLCPTTKHCHDVCWRISKPTCGSDGKLYPNGCSMKMKNCGRHVFEVPIANCRSHGRDLDNSLACPTNCLHEAFAPVCGSDGNLYDNECELNMLNCGNQRRPVTKVELDNCKSTAQKCSKITCPDYEEEPLCGTDGKTYFNKCHLQIAICRKNIQQAHFGPCTNTTVIEECPKTCPKIKKGEPRLCGSDGNVYSSECEMRRLTCGQRVVPVPLRHCQTTRYCNIHCEDKRDFVCGSNLKLYRNECQMRVNNCGKHIYKIPLKRCLLGFKFRGCHRLCPRDYDPVCGNDNKTYSNDCFLDLETCRSRSLVTKLHHGRCGEPQQEPKNYLYR